MHRKQALVTGATGAIGAAIAQALANDLGFAVTLVGRDEAKTKRLAEEIRTNSGNPHVSYTLCDLSRRKEITALAARWDKPLHVLINNAAQTPRKRCETPEGIELQFATNVLGYVWMIDAFRDVLRRSAPARVVNVASYWAGDLELDDLEFKRRPYSNNTAYRQSKQADRMLTAAYAERFKADGVTVNCCHPGDVNSQLSNNLGFGGHESPSQGADTPVWLATDPAGGQVTGKYFEHRRETHCRFAENRDAIEQLFSICHQYQ
ncbi:SDR family NAD(P)-dependent oxidoreductase [Candidatus Sumerlaeota bacterium]|nr:SDR family NAD(P)-dependent oxidoreductase [Candidatus Sumerlaeota bacterium]